MKEELTFNLTIDTLTYDDAVVTIDKEKGVNVVKSQEHRSTYVPNDMNSRKASNR